MRLLRGWSSIALCLISRAQVLDASAALHEQRIIRSWLRRRDVSYYFGLTKRYWASDVPPIDRRACRRCQPTDAYRHDDSFIETTPTSYSAASSRVRAATEAYDPMCQRSRALDFSFRVLGQRGHAPHPKAEGARFSFETRPNREDRLGVQPAVDRLDAERRRELMVRQDIEQTRSAIVTEGWRPARRGRSVTIAGGELPADRRSRVEGSRTSRGLARGGSP
jgi:hypothetical protein